MAKAQIQADMDTHSIPHLYLDKVSLVECTHEELEKYAKVIQEARDELARLETTTPETMWCENLSEFRNALVKRNYPVRIPRENEFQGTPKAPPSKAVVQEVPASAEIPVKETPVQEIPVQETQPES